VSVMMLLAVTAAQAVRVVSPDGSNVIDIARDGATFAVTRKGAEIIRSSPLGLDLESSPTAQPLVLVEQKKSHRDERIALAATKASSARDDYNQSVLTFEEMGGAKRRRDLEVRAFDDGVAFRYVIRSAEPVTVFRERTGFALNPADRCFASETTPAHEAQFKPTTPGTMKPRTRFDVPIICTVASGRASYAITQAHLHDYAGASLVRVGDQLRIDLSPVPDRPDVGVRTVKGLTSAWRVVMLADRAGDLIPSNLVGNLNPMPQGDFSWVKPGKAAWDWWSGPYTGMKATTENYRRYIDFAAESGFPYYVIDAGWAFGSGPCCKPLPTTDITRPVDGVDLADLARYAAGKGVGLILWVHWSLLDQRMDEALDVYRRWGISGIKVDFMNRDDQEIVKFYERLAAATAQRHLLLDLHGAYPPAGLNRTWPNFITQEGVMGAEHNKWSKDITPAHNVTLAYTRMLAGPMDYTPGGMRNGTPESFEIRDVMPMTQTTRGQGLAMFVIFESPLQMVADDPDAYRGAAGFDLIKTVPTAWDETRFLTGDIGKDIVLARRHGGTWYVGAMTDGTRRTESVSLRFLPAGRFRATFWLDGAEPNAIVRSERIVASDGTLELPLAPAGGAVVKIEPLG
jgi:alpha-glucosidase